MSNRWTIEDIESTGLKVSNSRGLNLWTGSSYSSPKFANNSDKKARIKVPAISANALTKHALRILDLKGFHVWRQNNAGVYDAKLKCYRANSSTPGISDIIGFHRKTGQFIACEIKAGKDKLSKEQQLFLDEVKRARGVAMVVRCIEDLETFLKQKV